MARAAWLLLGVACGGAADPAGVSPAGGGGDADGDGLTDVDEAARGTDPTLADSDKDGKSDGEEVHALGTDPLKRDTDGDGMGDGAEIKAGFNPLVAEAEATAAVPKKTAAQQVAFGAPVQPLVGADGALAEVWRCPKGAPNSTPVEQSACFLEVQGGTWQMGVPREGLAVPPEQPMAPPPDPSVTPAHAVTVSTFWLQRAEVNVGLYQRCLDAGGCSASEVLRDGALHHLSRPNEVLMPANAVSWEGARQLCAWIGGRLPTEAEWEFAARGSDNRRFPWGGDAWCGYAADGTDGVPPPAAPDWSCKDSGPRPTSLSPLLGPFGHTELAGNVWEWVADGWDPGVYARRAGEAVVDPRVDGDGARRVQRGGSWMTEVVWDRQATVRAGVPSGTRLPDVGFRCAWSPPR
jgi:formylglycine-generating enzyme required for sulfatase activity